MEKIKDKTQGSPGEDSHITIEAGCRLPEEGLPRRRWLGMAVYLAIAQCRFTISTSTGGRHRVTSSITAVEAEPLRLLFPTTEAAADADSK